MWCPAGLPGLHSLCDILFLMYGKMSHVHVLQAVGPAGPPPQPPAGGDSCTFPSLKSHTLSVTISNRRCGTHKGRGEAFEFWCNTTEWRRHSVEKESGIKVCEPRANCYLQVSFYGVKRIAIIWVKSQDLWDGSLRLVVCCQKWLLLYVSGYR